MKLEQNNAISSNNYDNKRKYTIRTTLGNYNA